MTPENQRLTTAAELYPHPFYRYGVADLSSALVERYSHVARYVGEGCYLHWVGYVKPLGWYVWAGDYWRLEMPPETVLGHAETVVRLLWQVADERGDRQQRDIAERILNRSRRDLERIVKRAERDHRIHLRVVDLDNALRTDPDGNPIPQTSIDPHRLPAEHPEARPDVHFLRSFGEVLAEFPKLTLCGHGAPRDQPFKRQPFKRLRKELVEADETRVRECALWLLEHIEPTLRINPRLPTSYGLKHRYERATGRYVENGLFIAAAICAGFDFDHGDVNVQFNMSKRSWAPYAPEQWGHR